MEMRQKVVDKLSKLHPENTTIQKDAYFANIALIESLRPKLNSFVLRVRDEDKEFVIFEFKGDAKDHWPEKSVKIPKKEFQHLLGLLNIMGFENVANIKKLRKTFDHRLAKITLDVVENLGTFVEIESKNGKLSDIEKVKTELEISSPSQRGYLTQTLKGTRYEKYIRG